MVKTRKDWIYIPVDKKVYPIPKKHLVCISTKRTFKFPYSQLEVGQSFTVTVNKYQLIAYSIQSGAKRNNIKAVWRLISVDEEKETKTYRVWRVE